MRWRDVVLNALRRFADRHGSRNIDRQSFLTEELPLMARSSGTKGRTPQQTVSRILQELRDEGLIEFLGTGSYVLLDRPFDVETTELPEGAIDIAIRANCLRLGNVETGDQLALARRRLGQTRVRALTLANYSSSCAVCDIADQPLLIASHILGWAKSAEHRGNLSNVICLCRFHDPLFELGYWSLSDDFKLLKRREVKSTMIRTVLDYTNAFRVPRDFTPSPTFLRQHRMTAGLSAISD